MKEEYGVIDHTIIFGYIIEVATENIKNILKDIGERVTTVVG